MTEGSRLSDLSVEHRLTSLEGNAIADRADIVALKDDMKGVRRFQTGFLAICGFVMATVAAWKTVLKPWFP